MNDEQIVREALTAEVHPDDIPLEALDALDAILHREQELREALENHRCSLDAALTVLGPGVDVVLPDDAALSTQEQKRCPTCAAKYDTPAYEPALCPDPFHTQEGEEG